MTGIKPRAAKLQTQIRNAEAKLAHKRDVMRQHPVGSAWHTRAALEAEAVEARLASLRDRLRRL